MGTKMKKSKSFYIFMCLLVCSLLTACGDSAANTGKQEVSVEETGDDADAKEDADSGEEAAGVSDSGEDTETDYSEKYPVYNNPIDEYYRPIIDSDEAQVTIRWAQDAYKQVWEEEFANLMQWLESKCVYEEDKQNIRALKENVEKQVEIQREVCETELLDTYRINPDPEKAEDGDSRNTYWGTGTRSRLNQMIGEIYRDASMRIILCSSLDEEDAPYEFRKIDYSKVTVV